MAKGNEKDKKGQHEGQRLSGQEGMIQEFVAHLKSLRFKREDDGVTRKKPSKHFNVIKNVNVSDKLRYHLTS